MAAKGISLQHTTLYQPLSNTNRTKALLILAGITN